MARTAPQTEKAEETRRRILRAAADAFAEHGYSATSLSDVIAAAGSTKGGFYFHFGSKAALGLAVVDDTRDAFRAEVLAATSDYTRASDQLVAMVRAIAAVHKVNPYASGFGRLCTELREEPEIAPGDIDPYAAWVTVVRDLLERARAEGDLDPAVDPLGAAIYALGAFIGVETLSERAPEEFFDHIDDHLRFSFRAVGLHSTLLDPS